MKLATVATAILLALAASPGRTATPQAPPEMQGSSQAVFCQGTYALCIKAPCVPIPVFARDGSITTERASCSCLVERGISMGPAECSKRQPVTHNGRTFLMSTYSNRFNNQANTLTCKSQSTVWAWCYGAPCVVDEHNPKRATCNCPVRVSRMQTLGGNCKTDNCRFIWSAATPAADTFANQHFFNYVQQHYPKYPVNRPANYCGGGPITK